MRDGVLMVRREQQVPGGDTELTVMNPDTGDWEPNPTGIDNAISALFPDPIRIGAMENAEEDASKAKTTTTIGKLANYYHLFNYKVMLAAGDTFRAAAAEQLKIWGQRAQCEVIAHEEGADPAAVVFDAMKAAMARKVDLLFIDTAGRLHNKANLMNELGKIDRIIKREIPEAPQETLLVLDATTGQNAITQAKVFLETAHVTGVVLTKLDGTAKGGVVIAIKEELGLPVKWIGIGEGQMDFRPFEPEKFVDALFETKAAQQEA